MLALIPVLLYLERAAAFRTQVMKAARVLAVARADPARGVGIANAVARADLAAEFRGHAAGRRPGRRICPSGTGITATSSPQRRGAVADAVTSAAQVDEAGTCPRRWS